MSRGWAAVASFAVGVLFWNTSDAKITTSTEHGFSLEHTVVLPATPEEAYDAMTGDISGWWDHHFSETPKAFYIEARPGGCFCEIFDDSGDGVVHGRVTYAQRGKKLRYEGPLGLSGEGLSLVITYGFEPHESGSSVNVTVNSYGVIKPGWDKAIDGVWHHFLFEQLLPYIESGAHKAEATSR